MPLPDDGDDDANSYENSPKCAPTKEARSLEDATAAILFLPACPSCQPAVIIFYFSFNVLHFKLLIVESNSFHFDKFPPKLLSKIFATSQNHNLRRTVKRRTNQRPRSIFRCANTRTLPYFCYECAHYPHSHRRPPFDSNRENYRLLQFAKKIQVSQFLSSTVVVFFENHNNVIIFS